MFKLLQVVMLYLSAGVAASAASECEVLDLDPDSGITCEDLAADPSARTGVSGQAGPRGGTAQVGTPLYTTITRFDGSKERVYSDGRHELYYSDGSPRGRNRVCSSGAGQIVSCHNFGENFWYERH